MRSADLFCRGAGFVSVALVQLQAVAACCLLHKESVVLKVAPGLGGAVELPHVLWDRTMGIV